MSPEKSNDIFLFWLYIFAMLNLEIVPARNYNRLLRNNFTIQEDLKYIISKEVCVRSILIRPFKLINWSVDGSVLDTLCEIRNPESIMYEIMRVQSLINPWNEESPIWVFLIAVGDLLGFTLSCCRIAGVFLVKLKLA